MQPIQVRLSLYLEYSKEFFNGVATERSIPILNRVVDIFASGVLT